MGWSSGSELMTKVIWSAKRHISESSRVEFYKDMINAFESFDCDTLYECLDADEHFNQAFQKLNPEAYNEIMDKY